MKISEMPYKPIPASVREIIDKIKSAESADEILELREKFNEILCKYETNANLSYIRYSCNTADEFYVKENDYFDETGPEVGNLFNEYNNALLNSPFRKGFLEVGNFKNSLSRLENIYQIILLNHPYPLGM